MKKIFIIFVKNSSSPVVHIYTTIKNLTPSSIQKKKPTLTPKMRAKIFT